MGGWQHFRHGAWHHLDQWSMNGREHPLASCLESLMRAGLTTHRPPSWYLFSSNMAALRGKPRMWSPPNSRSSDNFGCLGHPPQLALMTQFASSSTNNTSSDSSNNTSSHSSTSP